MPTQPGWRHGRASAKGSCYFLHDGTLNKEEQASWSKKKLLFGAQRHTRDFFLFLIYNN